jgi:hypothetical protein
MSVYRLDASIRVEGSQQAALATACSGGVIAVMVASSASAVESINASPRRLRRTDYLVDMSRRFRLVPQRE